MWIIECKIATQRLWMINCKSLIANQWLWKFSKICLVLDQHLSSIPPWYLSFDTTLDSSITLKRGTLFSTLEFFSETKTLTVSSSQVTCYFLQQLVCESVFGMSVTYQTNHYVIFKTLTQFTITTYFLFHVEVQFSAS